MADFLFAFNHLSPLSSKAAEDLSSHLSTRTFEKGQLLLKEQEVCRKLYFINNGLVKTYFSTPEKDFIMRFFPEKNLFTVLDSYTTGQPSTYAVMALEFTSVTYVEQADLELLCRKHHNIETAFRKLLAFAAVNMMKRISEMLEENATERYKHFLKDNADLLQRISLGDLADYLGITQVSLSRIRSKK